MVDIAVADSCCTIGCHLGCTADPDSCTIGVAGAHRSAAEHYRYNRNMVAVYHFLDNRMGWIYPVPGMGR